MKVKHLVTITSYIHPKVFNNIGLRPSPMSGRSITCWSHILSVARKENLKQFTEAEVKTVRSLEIKRIPPTEVSPQNAIALMLALDGQEELANRVRDMDYIHAWAMIWPLPADQEEGQQKNSPTD